MTEQNQPPEKKSIDPINTFKFVILPQMVSFLTRNIIGIRGFLISKTLQYGGRFLFDVFVRYLKQKQRDNEQSEAKEKKDKIVENPASTPEERGKAYEDYFNRR